MKKICLVVFLLAVCCAWAEEIPYKTFVNKQDCKAKCEELLTIATAGKLDEALKIMEPYWPFEGSEYVQIQIQTIKQMGLVKSRFGEAVGYEFVREEKIGEILLRLIYIQKCERHIIRWVFTFYKPNDKWLLNAIYWDDEISELFE